ncbi:hypothetical protein AB1L88_17550 [Tautonia sp. JC769]|uniref:hypothetical protein n=1 Tax=Tautonia sp. JC769 TaxID=3232135 RepID=UPI0034589DF6
MDEELFRSSRSGRQPPPREETRFEGRSSPTPEPSTDDDASAFELPAVHRYLVQLIVDRDEADALYRRFVPSLSNDARNHPDPHDRRPRIVLRTALIRWLVDLQQSGQCPIPIPELDGPIESARFDAIWRSELLERTWQRLKDLQEESGQPFFLALRQRYERPGLSAPELADRLARALDRPVTPSQTQRLLRRANEHFSRMLLDAVIATLPHNPPFATIERELIETNLLAFCREVIGRLRPPPPSPGRRPAE